MIKECAVVMTNELVTVVKFGDHNIQLPSIHSNAKYVKVAKEDGKYVVLEDSSEKIFNDEKKAKSKRSKSLKKTVSARSLIDNSEEVSGRELGEI